MSDLPEPQSDLPAPQPIQAPPAAQPRPNPFVGPRAYQWGERIYGRDLETYKLANLLSAERVVLFYSPSGAGKTSLIHAALIPELQEREFHMRAVVRVNREPAKPPASLPPSYNRYIFSMLSWLESAWPETEQIPEEELVGLRLANYMERRPRPEEFNFEVFIFDQFEEILTLDTTDQAAKHEFFEQIGDLLGDRTRWGLFSMREDFKAALDPYILPVPTRFSTTFRLELLGVEAAHQAMQGPAKSAGVEFTSPAADALIDDLRLVQVQNPDGTYRSQLGPYVEPVQLQVVCYRLWESLEPGATQIDPQHLAKIKNVGQALADYYALRVAEAAQKADVSERLIRQWFERELITEGGIRGQVLMGARFSRGLDNRAIRLLEDAHLVRAEKRGNSIWYELSHDRLIEPVKENNAAWFEANLSLLQRQAALWNDEDRPDGLLIVGGGLVNIQKWANEHTTDLMPAEMDFLAACNKAQRSANRERDRNRLMAVLAVLVTIAAIVAVIAWRSSVRSGSQAKTNAHVADTQAARAIQAQQMANAASTQAVSQRIVAEGASTQAVNQKNLAEIASTQAVSQKNLADIASTQAIEQGSLAKTAEAEAVKQRDLTEQEHRNFLSRQLAASSVREIQNSPDLGLLLAVEALSVTDTTEAQSSLLGGLASDHPLAYLRGSSYPVDDMEFSPDGKLLATTGYDGTRLWEIPSSPPITQAITSTFTGVRVAFSPDGKYLATLRCSGSIAVHDITRAASPTLVDFYFSSSHKQCNDAPLGDLVFSPGGVNLAASINSNLVTLWNIGTRQAVTLTGSTSLITHLAFSPDGALLVSGSDSGEVHLWNVSTHASVEPPLPTSPLTNTISVMIFGKSDVDLELIVIDTTGMAAGWDITTNSLQGGPQDVGIKNIAAISMNSQLIASLDGNTVKVGYDIGSLRPLIGHNAPVTAVAISPDLNLFASGSKDGAVILWSQSTHIQVGTPITTTLPILALSYVQAGGNQNLIGGSSEGLFRWDPTNHKRLEKQDLPLGVTIPITITPSSLAFRPNGMLVMGGADGSAFLWDITKRHFDRKLVPDLAGLDLHNVIASPNGQKIAAWEYGKIWVWDIDTTKVISRTNDFGTVSNLTFSPDGNTLVYTDFYGNITTWDIATGKTNTKINPGKPVKMAVSPDGKMLATSGNYSSLDLWDIRTSKKLTTLITTTYSDVQVIAFSPDGGRIGSGSSDGSITIWDANGGSPVKISNPSRASILCLGFSPDGQLLAAGDSDGFIHLWGVSRLNSTSDLLVGHSGAATSLAFSPDGQWLASSSNDNTIRIWDVRTGQQAGDPLAGQILRSFIPGTASLAFKSDGSQLAIGSNEEGLIILFDLRATPPLTQVLTAHSGQVNALAFSHDGRYLASGGSDGKLILWDTSTGTLLNNLLVKPSASINNLKFSPDDRTLAAGIDSEIYRWSISPPKAIGSPLEGHTSNVSQLAFSPDGSILASQEDNGSILLWDATSGRLLRKIENQADSSNYGIRDTLMFSPDGKILVSGLASGPNEITLWDAASGKLIGNLVGHHAQIDSLAFSPDGSMLVSSANDSRIYFWQITPQAWRERACGLVGRNLSWHEWETYLAETGQPYRATCSTNPINYRDVAQGYAEKIRFLVKTQDIAQAQQTLAQAMSWITPLKAREAAVAFCQIDIPPGFFNLLTPVCQLAAQLTTNPLESAGYSLKIGNKTAAIQSLQQAAQQAIQSQNVEQAAKICDYGNANVVAEGVAEACIYVAEKAVDIDTQVSYYFKAGAVISATAVLQRGTQEAVETNSHDLAVTICRLGNTNHLSKEVAQACMVAAQTARQDADRVEFYSLGGDSAKATQALQNATRLAKDSNDSYTAGLLCTAGARYHLQPSNTEACLFAAEATSDYLARADFYALGGDRQQAKMIFTQALEVAQASSDLTDDKSLCWIGSLDGFATLVMPVCENAVAKADPQTTAVFQDVRGLARALSGNTGGAISDFQAYIDWLKTDGYFYYLDAATRERIIAERQSWIEALKAGRNPFDADTLMALRYE